MDLEIGKNTFIETWGQMSTQWGINPNMAHIHALMLVSAKPLCMEQIMEKLKISRGSACENIHNLSEWELISKHPIEGQRKDYFVAEKDMWRVMRLIAKHRKRKELDPVIQSLSKLECVECSCDEAIEFKQVVNSIVDLSKKTDRFLDKFCSSANPSFPNFLVKMLGM